MQRPDSQREARLDLAGLCTAAADMLGGDGPDDQRVRAVPDARTVRYYQSIGLVDRPERDGRDAVYGWRHLLQLVAVKRLQLRGEPLSRIQAALTGVTTEALEAALNVAVGSPEPPPPRPPTDDSSFLSREIAPGVLVVVDPRRVADPDSLFLALTRALRGGTR